MTIQSGPAGILMSIGFRPGRPRIDADERIALTKTEAGAESGL